MPVKFVLQICSGDSAPKQILPVPRRGIEPPWITPPVPKTGAATNYATWANFDWVNIPIPPPQHESYFSILLWLQIIFLLRNTSGFFLYENSTGFLSLWSKIIFYVQLVVRDNFLAVARKFPRPYLAVSCAHETSLRFAQKHKTCRRAGVCVFCAPSRVRTYDLILKRDLLYQLSYGRIN